MQARWAGQWKLEIGRSSDPKKLLAIVATGQAIRRAIDELAASVDR